LLITTDILLDSNYTEHKWEIGAPPSIVIDDVCRKCFQICYSIPNSSVLNIVKDIKNGAILPQPKFNDTTALSPVIINGLLKFASKKGLPLSKEQIVMLHIPNSTSSIITYSWMYTHFNLVGDFIPNSNGEIHLEPIDIKDLE